MGSAGWFLTRDVLVPLLRAFLLAVCVFSHLLSLHPVREMLWLTPFIQSAFGICGFFICSFNQLDWKYSEEEKKARKLPKAKLEFAKPPNYLHNIYIILGIFRNLEMI